MSDFNYSYSLGPGDTFGSQPADPELWSFTGIRLEPESETTVRLVDERDGKTLLVQPEVATVLTHCEHFRTLRGHAEHLVRTLPQLGGQIEPLIPVLAQIRDAGFMHSAEDMLARLIAQGEERAQAPVRVFIITADRPEAVERLLNSLEQSKGLNLPESYWLIDDSRNSENQAKNQTLVNACNARGLVSLQYFGLEARERLITELAQTLPQHDDAIRFLLDRGQWHDFPTYGISRTLALLLGVGHRCVVLDDDVLCQAIRPPLPGAEIRFGSVNAREAVFYGSQVALEQNQRALPDNPITLIARQLGRDLSSGIKTLLHGTPTAAMLAGANGAFLRSLTATSPIVSCQCSSWGDPGTSGAHWVAHLDPKSLGRLLDCPEGLSVTVDARASWYGYTAPTLSKNGVMSQITGYDASVLLPPFVPAFRGEDAIFAYMLAALQPDSLVLNHPWAITHKPLSANTKQSFKTPIPATGGLTLLTRWLVDQVNSVTGETPEVRLSQLASALRELMAHSPDALTAFAQEQLALARKAQLSTYQQQLTIAPELNASGWTGYLQRGVQELTQALEQGPNTKELLGHDATDIELAMASIQQAGNRFASALEAWPDIWQAAAGFEF